MLKQAQRISESSILERNIATQSDSRGCTCFWVAVSLAFSTLKLLAQTHRLNLGIKSQSTTILAYNTIFKSTNGGSMPRFHHISIHDRSRASPVASYAQVSTLGLMCFRLPWWSLSRGSLRSCLWIDWSLKLMLIRVDWLMMSNDVNGKSPIHGKSPLNDYKWRLSNEIICKWLLAIFDY